MKQLTFYTLTAKELNQLIMASYKIPEFICSMEAPNGTSVECRDITKGSWQYTDSVKECVQEYLHQGWCDFGLISYILLDMCEHEVIEPGNYLIDLSW